MVMQVEIKVVKDEATPFLRGLPKKALRIGNRDTWNLTQFGASELIRQAKVAKISPWRGRLLTFGKGIEPRKISRGIYGIFIPKYGIYLDRMHTHAVALKRGRLITKWAKDKLGETGRAVVVRAHPYINEGFRRIVQRAELTAQRIANEVVGG